MTTAIDDEIPSALRSWLGATLGPIAFLALWFAPLPLDPAAHKVAAIFGVVVIAWVTEVIPISATALLIAPALLITGAATDLKKVFAPYADPLLFLFVGGFLIARAMTIHGLDRRLALSIACSPWVAGRAGRMRAAMALGTFLLTMWISNTSAAAIFIPILLGLAPRSSATGTATSLSGSILAIAYASSLGGLGTPLGSPPNLITMRLLQEAGTDFGFVDWVVVALPTGILGCVAAMIILGRSMPPGTDTIDLAEASIIRSKPWSYGERATLSVFALAVLGWVVPGIADAIGWDMSSLKLALDPSVVAMAASGLLFMIPTEQRGQRVLSWKQAVNIDWGVILLFGGGILLGNQMDETGLSRAIGEGFLQVTGVDSLWGLTAVCIFLSLLLTEVASNTATATMLVPLAIGMAEALGVSTIPPVLGVGLAASTGFILPIATGPNAIAFGTGFVQARQMMRAGIVLDGVCAVIIFLVLRFICPIMGWD